MGDSGDVVRPAGIFHRPDSSLLGSATVPGVGQAALIPGTLIASVTGPLCATLPKPSRRLCAVVAPRLGAHLTATRAATALAAVTRRLDADTHTTTTALGRLLATATVTRARTPASVDLLALLR